MCKNIDGTDDVKTTENKEVVAQTLGYTPSYQQLLIGHNGPMMNAIGDPDRSKYWSDGEWMMIDNRTCGLTI